MVQLAGLALRRGQIESATELLDGAAAIAPSTDRTLQIQMELVRYVITVKTKGTEAAERLLWKTYQRAVNIGDLYYQAAVLNNLGFNRLQAFRYDEAIAWYSRAIAAAEKFGANRIASVAMNNLGICYYRLGDFEKAQEIQKRAVEIQTRAGLRPNLQATLGEIGNVHMLQGDASKAIPYYKQALGIAREVGHAQSIALWAANLARAYAEIGDWDSAERINNTLSALNAETKDSGLEAQAKLNAAFIAAARGRSAEAAGIYQQVIASSVQEPAILWEAHAGLGDVYRSIKNAARAGRHYERALRVIDKTRTGLLASDYKITFLNSLIRFYRKYVDMLVDQRQHEKALQVVESSRARIFAEKAGIDSRPRLEARDYTAMARALDATLLSYWLGPSRSFVWVVTPRGTRLFELPPESQIRSLTTAYNAAISDGRDPISTNHPAGAALANALLSAARPHVHRGSRVIVVPDGVLHRLNLETLPVDGRYWIEEVVLAVAPSLNYLNEHARAASHNRNILLIGDPDYGSSSVPKLLHAGKEIESIRRAFDGRNVVAYTGGGAQPGAFRHAAPGGYSVIHFAAHAVANTESPLDSAILLAPDGHAFKLYARDVVDMPLKANLVTLSACRSAGARVYSGEGLVGLAWAFLQAGAQNVIGGLWDVADASTARLMEAMYSDLAKGQAPADALRNAKLSLLHSNTGYKKPFYWAPFQIYARVGPWPTSRTVRPRSAPREREQSVPELRR